jgi:ribosome maturation factor RimP
MLQAALAAGLADGYIGASHHHPRVTGGGLNGPPFLFLAHERPHHEGLEARIAEAIAPTIEHMGYELVRVQVSGKERPVVQIMADRADEAPFRVEDCEAISHAVGAVLDVEDPIKGEWTLEVSSPGIDRPLTRTKDWNRFAGHLASLELVVPQDGRKRFRGIALGADAETVRLRLEDGTDASFPRGNLRRAKLVLTDALIAATAAPPPDGTEDADGAAPGGQPYSQRN